MSQDRKLIPAVNFHIWQPCNMRCLFCFATYDSLRPSTRTNYLSQDQAAEVLRALRNYGFRKVTFSGGEPTLYPWLLEIICEAKSLGFTTNVVTNGSTLTPAYVESLAPGLDWLTCSIDSLRAVTNLTTGRAIAGTSPISAEHLVHMMNVARSFSIRTRVNTVVTKINYTEKLLPFIRMTLPERWKVLRYLEITDENSMHTSKLKVTDEEFNTFIANNQPVPHGTVFVPQYNENLMGSYIMLDPLGRFIDNSSGKYQVSKQILEVGVDTALQHIEYSYTKFVERGGLYDW